MLLSTFNQSALFQIGVFVQSLCYTEICSRHQLPTGGMRTLDLTQRRKVDRYKMRQKLITAMMENSFLKRS